MKIDTSKIENFESMSLEEKLEAMQNYEIPESKPDYTGYVKKDLFDKKASELASAQRELKAKMSEEEQAEVERKEQWDQMVAHVKELESAQTLAEYGKQFLKSGYPDALASDSAKALLEGNMQKVFQNQEKFLKEKEALLREEILKGTPKPPAGAGSAPKMTKEQFDKLGYTERAKLQASDPDLYNELIK